MATLLVGISLAALAQPDAGVREIQLQNSQIHTTVTPDIGGRLLWVSQPGGANLLRVSEQVAAQPRPEVTAAADNIGYLGGEVWLGPQSQWWQQQRVNLDRRAAKADWPPDPYLILSTYQLAEATPTQVRLEGPVSPVSGVQLRKQFWLEGNALHQQVRAHNIRDTAVAWDLWFTNRVAASASVYVPIEAAANMRVQSLAEGDFVAPHIQQQSGYARLAPIFTPRLSQRGKVFIQPSRGFIAAFDKDQLLLVEFTLLPEAQIHPQHGQVELFIEAAAGAFTTGLIELEIHGEYATRAPKTLFSLTQRLRVIPYFGAATAAAHVDFLAQVIPSTSIAQSAEPVARTAEPMTRAAER